MSEVIIALGSNTLQSAHIQWASQALTAILGDIRTSRVIWTQDVKGRGLWFMNRLMTGHTTLPKEVLEQQLKDLERKTGRSRESVTIDLDLMQYDNRRQHLQDWSRPYIQQLLPDIF